MSPTPLAIFLLALLILWLAVTQKLDAVWAALQGQDVKAAAQSPSPSQSQTGAGSNAGPGHVAAFHI